MPDRIGEREDMTLEARQITVQIGRCPILQDISLSVVAGEVLAVIGPNGAGKSTLLKVLSGDLAPSQGDVWMNGKPLDAWQRKERAQMRAILPQNASLTFAFTVLEVALIGRTPHIQGRERPLDYAIARAALEAAGVLALQDRLYTTLSGGEKQRVQLARILAQIWTETTMQTRFLLLDEPTNSLDLSHQHSTLDIARQFARQGVGVLAILHDLNLAAQYADRILVLKDRGCLASGTPYQVLTPTIIQQAFDMLVMVSPHPCYNCPLVIPVPIAQTQHSIQLEILS
jgi:iron complex transport system ATP-binding protein